jgi:hypothetical protein
MSINIPVSDRVNKAIEILAKRDDTSVSTKALELIQTALELEEDAGLLMIVEEREKSTKKSDYLSHEEVWG